MKVRIICLFVFIIVCSGCIGQQSQDTAEPVRIYRFDKDLLRLVETDNQAAVEGELLCDYPEMLEVIGKAVLNIQTTETPGFFNRLTNFYSEPTLNKLYHDAVRLYDSIPDIERELGKGFDYLKKNFPQMPIPKVYMHVSGLSQNVLVAENLLSISIDKYLGDYELYDQFFQDWQQVKMQRRMVVPDYLAGWLMSEFPFEGRENVLIERIVYEGKIKYLLEQALPDLQPYILAGYTEQDYAWCSRNEGDVWKSVIERKHLYQPDHIVTNRYFEEAPATFIAVDAPGNIGSWLGWQIVKRYMSETGATPAMLMGNTNAQDILAKSKYKPF